MATKRFVAIRGERGFTLLELLIALSIVGIISAIAVPRYSDYRARAFDARAQSDLRNIAMAQEVYFLDNEEYLSCDNQNCLQLPGIARISAGVTLSVVSEEEFFIARSSHSNGSGREFVWDSAQGGMVEE